VRGTRFGHAVDDRVLQIVATTTRGVTRRAARQTDLPGRLGGEEFAARAL
jgi:PleD family two-component response regulator